MGRLETVFSDGGKPAFIGFTVAGDPDKNMSVRVARALIAGGTDILELGIPFSDPVADGPMIQKADERALGAGVTPSAVFDIVREIRTESNVPIVFLTYYNIVYHRGIEQFYREAHDAGVDGILIADMPVEESYKTGEMLNTLERALAARDGRTRKDDVLYDIYFEKEDAGGRKYIRQDLEKAKSHYYQLMGWDVKTGIPTRPTLEKLGLKDVADGLEKKGR